MKRKVLSILLIGVLVIGLTGCGNNKTNNNDSSNNTSSNETSNKSEDSQKERIVSCTLENDDYVGTDEVYLNGDKITKTILTHTNFINATSDFDKRCESTKKTAEKENSIEGITATVDCNSNERTITDKYIYDMDDITDKGKIYTFDYVSNGKFDLTKWESHFSEKVKCEEK